MFELFKKHYLSVAIILLGNTLYAFGLVAFILPHRIIMGGSTGLGLTLNFFTGVPLSTFVFYFNITMFILGAFVLGRKFALTTIISTFYFPVILDLFQRVPTFATMLDNRFWAAVSGGLLIGIAIGLVISCGGSTGGMDIPPLVINKKLGIPIPVLIYIFDVLILVMQMFYSDWRQIGYGILLVAIYSVVIDRILIIGKAFST